MKLTMAALAAALTLPALAGETPKAPSQTAAGPAKPAKDSFKNEDERALYAVGFLMGRNVGSFQMSPSEVKAMQSGLGDAALGRPAVVDIRFHQSRINELLQRRVEAAAAQEKAKGRVFAEKFARDEKPTEIAGGGWYKEISAGDGAAPQPADTVKVHYRGTLIDGTEFDSSYSRNEPAVFALNQVIPCWTKGVGMMRVGGKAKLLCPSEIAYGDQGRPPTIKGGAALLFEVELLEIAKEEPKPDAKAEKGGKKKS